MLAVLDLPANQLSQSCPTPLNLGWIGWLIQNGSHDIPVLEHSFLVKIIEILALTFLSLIFWPIAGGIFNEIDAFNIKPQFRKRIYFS